MLRVFYKEAKYEFLKALRFPGFSLPVILFPVMFYILFGLLLPTSQAANKAMATYLLGTYGAFGVMGVSLFGFGVSIAQERGYGWLELKQASPMPPMAYFVAKLVMAMLFSLIVVSLLMALGLSFGHVQLAAGQLARVAGILILGSVPFGSMGIMIGYVTKPTSTPAIVNLMYLPMSFFSGLWVPLQFFPEWLQKAAPFLPPYHLSRLALGVFGASEGHWATNVAALAAFTIVFLAVAWLASGSRLAWSRPSRAAAPAAN